MSVKIQQPTFYLLPLEAFLLLQRATLQTAPLKVQFYVGVVLTVWAVIDLLHVLYVPECFGVFLWFYLFIYFRFLVT